MNKEKLFKVSKTSLIVAIITAIMLCVSLGLGLSKGLKKEEQTAQVYYSVKSNIDAYATANIVYVSSFAEKSGKIFYLAEDANDYYIISISDSMFNKMKKEYEKNGYLNYTVYGYVRKLDYDVQKLGVEAVAEAYDAKDFSMTDFVYYYGNTYLDCTYNPNRADAGIFYGLAAVCAIISVSCFISYFSSKKNLNKILSVIDEDRILSWIEDPQTVEFEKFGIYLTRDHLIARNGRKGAIKNVINYKDIAWSYLINHKQYFVTVSREIMLWLKNGSSVSVGSVSPKDKEGLIDKFYSLLVDKNDDILIGYTQPNIARYNEFKKQYKETQDDTLRVTGPKESDIVE